ncbi:MAG: hypothetical protein U1F87_09290 [Kiritimatiellia bacterium]
MAAQRLAPRISVNKLGEYIVASPARRKRIIYDQKFPQKFITARYADAQQFITEYLAQTNRHTSYIAAAISQLMSIPARSEWEEQNNALCAGALEHFIEVEDKLTSQEFSYTPLNPLAQASCTIANVEISIRPELEVVINQGKKLGQCGIVKLAFSKTNPITADVGDTTASLLHHYCESTMAKGSLISRDMCMLVDVFGEKVVSAPKSFKRRMKDVEAACQEIDALWPRIK